MSFYSGLQEHSIPRFYGFAILTLPLHLSILKRARFQYMNDQELDSSRLPSLSLSLPLLSLALATPFLQRHLYRLLATSCNPSLSILLTLVQVERDGGIYNGQYLKLIINGRRGGKGSCIGRKPQPSLPQPMPSIHTY